MVFLLPQTIDEMASRSPEHEAFRCRGEGLSYAQLVAQTNRLAHLLIERGVKPGDRVGVRLPRCLESPVAVHGIMKAGAVFVPIDPWLPESAVVRLLADCGVRHLITHDVPWALSDSSLETIIGPEAVDGLIPVLPWTTLDAFPADRCPDVRTTERDLAYIMYTSGSTGRPKGIMHTHRSGLSYAELSVHTYDVRSEDRIGNHSPLHFDMSTFGYFAGPLAGATTVLIPEEYTKLPASLSQLMEVERLTIWYSVPSPLVQLHTRGALERRDLTSLRWIKYGGEPFPMKHLKALMEHWPHARFSNVYGPAEVNQCTWYHLQQGDADDPQQPVPIGRVWEDTDGLVIDPDDEPITNELPGELVIRSATMMQGYWNQAELTEKSFYTHSDGTDGDRVYYRTGDLVRRRLDGNLVFLGRLDRQIKTRGHRVELDDVEAALVSCDHVVEAAAWPVDDGEGSRLIAAGVILDAESELTVIEVMSAVRKCLPAYAVPSQIDVHRDFPRTATGKIDRRALAESSPQSEAASAELVQTELNPIQATDRS